MSSKLVSIIIPVYNAESFLSDMLNSLIKQTYSNIEIVLIDDGSTDLSAHICKEYVTRYKNIKLYHTPNNGVSSARNLGLHYANGSYIAFCDADDIVSHTLIECLVNNIENNNSDLAIGSIAWRIEGIDKMIKFRNDTIFRKNYSSLFTSHNLAKYGGPCAKLFKKEIIHSYNLLFNKNIKFCEDIIFLFQYLLHTNSVSTTEECLYYYIDHNNSYSKCIYSYTNEWEGYNNFYSLIETMRKSFLNEDAYNQLKYTTVFIDRVIRSIYKDYLTPKERIAKLKEINWDIYRQSEKVYNWKEWILKQLLSFRLFYLYDYIIINIVKNK